MNFYGQLVGILAMILSFLIYQQKSRKNMVICKLITDLLWTTHFLMIGSITAVATTSVAILREIVFYNNDKKWGESRVWIFVFSTMFLLSAVLTWKNMISMFPAVSSVISTIGFWVKVPEKIKVTVIPASVGMLVYNISCMSIAGIINEILALISIMAYFAKKKLMERKI